MKFGKKVDTVSTSMVMCVPAHLVMLGVAVSEIVILLGNREYSE